jgi:hypothetical protein
MRELTGYITCQGNYPAWDFSHNYPTPENGALDQPPPRCVYLDATNKTARLCHDTSLPLDHNNNLPNSQMSLCTTPGDIIPFKTTKPGDGTLGWYFAEEDYSPLFDTQGNLATDPVLYDMPNRWPNKYPGTPTVKVCNIIVEDPPPSIDHHYYWVPPSPSERLLPSDLYYSVTLTHPALHDFDWNGNGLYGQYFWNGKTEESLDNTNNFTPTTRPQVWVGRAPIATIEDAQTFVDKVLTYETLQAPDGTPVDRDYLRRVVYGADLLNEHFPPSQIPDPTKGYPNPPDQGNFNFQPGKLMIHLQDDLFADINGQDPIWSNPNVVLRFYSIWPEVSTDIEIPSNYSLTGKTDLHYQTGWYFVNIEDNQLIQSFSPTPIVVFFGENLMIQPQQIFWFPNQRVELRPDDGNDSTRLKEDIRDSIETNFPGFTEERRYYADYFGLLQTRVPIERLNVNSIRSALDSGCHFVSLSGHGGSQGCCNVWWATFNSETLHPGPYSKGYWICPDFKNDKRYYIVFANSCYTAEPDNPHNISLGERMVLDPKGGALAYVGNVRTGVAECRFQERTFWWNLKRNGRIGPAAGIPPPDLSGFWVRYELMLYGDPEMPVWTDIPGDYQVLSTVEVPTDEVIHAQAFPGEVIKIAVFSNSQPVQKQQVTFMGGWSGSENDPLILKTLETDDAGLVHFAVPVDAVAGDLLTMTITPPFAMNGHANFKPFVMSILIIRPHPS